MNKESGLRKSDKFISTPTLFFALMLSVFLLYQAGTRIGLFLDDFHFWVTVSQNPKAGSLFFTVYPPVFYRPLEYLLMLGNYKAAGFDPIWYHIAAVIGHLATVAVVFIFTRRLGFGSRSAVFAAAVFAFAQINAMAVLGNDTAGQVFSVLLGLLALCCLLPKGELKPRHMFAAALLLFFSLLWKESGATFILCAVFLSWHKRAGLAPGNRSASLRFWAPLMVIIVVYFVLRIAADVPSPGFGQSLRYELWIGKNIPVNIGMLLFAVLTPIAPSILVQNLDNRMLLVITGAIVALYCALILAGLYMAGKKDRYGRGPIAVCVVLFALSFFPDCLANQVSELYGYKTAAFMAVLTGVGLGSIFSRILEKTRQGATILAVFLVAFLTLNALSVHHKRQVMEKNADRAWNYLDQIQTRVPNIPEATFIYGVNLDPPLKRPYSVYAIDGLNVLAEGKIFETIYGRHFTGFSLVDEKSLESLLKQRSKPALVLRLMGQQIKPKLYVSNGEKSFLARDPFSPMID